MKLEIFQKALLATARVACCASLLAACQKTDEKVNTPTGDQNTPESMPDSNPSGAMTLDECKAHTVAVFTTKTATQTEDTKACCAQIAQSIDGGADPITATSQWAERGECCSTLDWQGSMACTPWGPPCPPAMGA